MSIIEAMVIDMDEAQVRTLEQVRQVVAGTQALEFRRPEDDEGRYGWIERVLHRFGYRQLGRVDKGAVLAYLQRLSGPARVAAKPLVKNYRRPEHAFARRYTAADVALLAEVDRTMGTLSGPATACVLRRQRDVFKVAGFERLGDISVAHLYNLRRSAGYRAQRVVVATVQTISEAHLLPVIEQMLEQFPFEILGFHADNGSEYVNHRVAKLLDKLNAEFTRSRPRHGKNNGLAETKNGAWFARSSATRTSRSATPLASTPTAASTSTPS